MAAWRNIILDPIELAEIYEWLDSIPLSRPKGQIEKDFADGVLTAEIVKHYFPQIVDLRNYAQARNLQERMSNWRLLNGKIFSRLGLTVPEHIMTQLSIAKAGIVEVFLYNLRESIRSMMLYRDMDPRIDPRLDPRLGGIRGLYGTHGLQDPLLYKYGGLLNQDPLYKYNMLAPTDPMLKYADMDLYFYRKQQLQDQSRVLLAKSGTVKNAAGRKKVPTGAPSNAKSPALGYSQSNALPALITDRERNTNNVSKIELEEKTQEILARDEEITTLNAKLKRLEHLLGLKDARIQDLQSQLDKLKPAKRHTNTNGDKTPANNA